MSDEITNNTFFEVQAEKFYQKKVEVARGVIELGQILIETKEGFKGQKGAWTNWIRDGRVNMKETQVRKYMTIARELEQQNNTSSVVLSQLSVNKLFELASAPEEVKEDVANSKDKEEAEKKIKEYEEQIKKLKREKQTEENAKNIVIESNLELQKQLEKEKTKKPEIKEIEVQVTPDDYYRNKQELKEKENELCRKEEELRRKEREIQEQQNKLKEQDERMKQYQEIQERLVGLGIDEEDGNTEYNKALALLQDLSSKVGYLIIKDIPPAKYKPCLKFEDTKKEYSKILDEIDKWTNELRGYLYKENLDDDIIKIIDVEVK